MAPRRAAAASRVLATLQAELEAAKAAAGRAAGSVPAGTTAGASDARGGNGTATATPPNRASGPAQRPSGHEAKPAPGDGPLLEVKPSPLASDLDRLGERLAIFMDRVELRDRNDRVRQMIRGEEITDVVVHKKLTGAVLTIENVGGPVIVAKGLRPEQADEARDLIMRTTRPARPVDRSSRPTRGTPASTPAPGRPRHVDEADLLRKLGDLHRVGILTDEEYEEKIELVGRLVRGEDLSPTPT
ncbi:MAG: SHOCT domain-containing protein [Acidimicrobiales bacterium]